MFQIAKSSKGTIRFDAGAGPVEIAFDFRWLSMSERMDATADHDRAMEAVTQAEPQDGESPSNRVREYNELHAKLIVALARGWDLALEDGQPAPFDVPTVAAFLDAFPAAFGLILAASHVATSLRAIEGN